VKFCYIFLGVRDIVKAGFVYGQFLVAGINISFANVTISDE
jgi:hypothetical protein